MLGWIKSLFGYADRTSAAAGRTAKAWEEIADATEAARDELLKRLGNPTPIPIEESTPRGRKTLAK